MADLATAVDGTVRGDGAAVVSGVVVDSRRIRPGDLFVALAGDRTDGHEFVAAALGSGAAGAVVSEEWLVSRAGRVEGALVGVADTRRALLDLAADERARDSATVIGITGSTGKTCTKDFTAAVLGQRFRTVASAGSFNNEVGLPLTILSASEDTEVLVCEMGSRGPGHIKLLCDVARPDLGIVTNVGVAHMELFGSPEVLRDAKAELPEALPSGGIAVLNADDAVVRGYAARTAARVVFYGLAEDAGVRAAGVELSRDTGAAAFELRTPSGTAAVELAVPGEHLVPDALGAAAAGWALGVPVRDIAGALTAARVSAGRMDVFVASGGFRVIDDSYNANPTSMAAALRSARWMAGDGRCIAVLGHMAELGPIEDEEHERIGELCAHLGVDGLVVVGPEGRRIAAGAEREGIEPDRVVTCRDAEEAVRAVASLAGLGDLVLVKASRAAGLDRVTDLLRAQPEGSVAVSGGAP
jgi:UDP-N-acetylmuramoyl-tripeptide--D-alanyl-D-alanine ligase